MLACGGGSPVAEQQKLLLGRIAMSDEARHLLFQAVPGARFAMQGGIH